MSDPTAGPPTGLTGPGLPPLALLSLDQAAGIACARCGGKLYGPVYLGIMYDVATDAKLRLWSCLGCCTPEEREGATRPAPLCTLCTLCEERAGEPIIIGRVAGNSGPGWTQYAHAECASERGYRALD